jgi:type I restriction enzyme S subunit
MARRRRPVADHLEADLDAKLISAQSLRQAILRHAFAGRLVPQDPNDEPTSELLKRIATEREQREAPVSRRRRATSQAPRYSARGRLQHVP